MDDTGWQMVDAVKENRKLGRHFPIPTDEQQSAVEVGMHAQVAFTRPAPPDGGRGWDVVWVIVDRVEGTGESISYSGIVDWDCTDIAATGDRIDFDPRNIIRIMAPVVGEDDPEAEICEFRSIA